MDWVQFLMYVYLYRGGYKIRCDMNANAVSNKEILYHDNPTSLICIIIYFILILDMSVQTNLIFSKITIFG